MCYHSTKESLVRRDSARYNNTYDELDRKIMIIAGRPVDLQLFRYLAAGGSAFITEYILFFVLFIHGDLGLFVANSISFCGGLVVSFSLNRTWAFRKGNFRLRGHHQFGLYASLAAANLVFTNVLIGFLTHHGLAPLIAKLFVMGTIATWNFLIFRRLIFAAPKVKGDGEET